MEKDIVLSGQELHKSFGPKDSRRHILKGVSFELYSGEILGIVGESGSGKEHSFEADMRDRKT